MLLQKKSRNAVWYSLSLVCMFVMCHSKCQNTALQWHKMGIAHHSPPHTKKNNDNNSKKTNCCTFYPEFKLRFVFFIFFQIIWLLKKSFNKFTHKNEEKSLMWRILFKSRTLSDAEQIFKYYRHINYYYRISNLLLLFTWFTFISLPSGFFHYWSLIGLKRKITTIRTHKNPFHKWENLFE